MRQTSIDQTSLGSELEGVGRSWQRSTFFPKALRGKRITVLCAAALIALIAFVDWRLVDDVPIGFLYLLPMVMLGRELERWQTLLVAALCTYLTENFDAFPWNWRTGLPRDALYFMAFFSIGVFVHEVNRNRQIVLDQLQEIQRQSAARLDAEKQLTVLIESSPAAIVTTNIAGTILMANEAAHRLLGHPVPGLLGKSLNVHFPSLANVMQRGGSQQLFRTTMQAHGQREDGEAFLAEICFSTYQTESGVRFAAMILDSSEEFRSREESSLHQMLAASRIAVSAVSHEIRNVCGAIAAVHRNLSKTASMSRHKDFEALGNLVLALERIAAVDLRPYPERVHEIDLSAILEDLKIVISPSLQDNDIGIAWELPQDLPLVWADGTNLMQVFLNLTTNSVRVLAESASARFLTISARNVGDRVLVHVMDTGGGVSDVAELFRPFQAGARNTGLGLYLARSFARSFGGDLRYESRPGAACFTVELASVQESASQ